MGLDRALAVCWVSTLLLLTSGVGADSGLTSFARQYLRDMMLQRELAVDLNVLCVERATHAELRSLCAVMRDERTRELQELRDLLATGPGEVGATEGCEPHPREVELTVAHNPHRLAQRTGDAFDQELLEAMARLYRIGLEEAERCTACAVDAELRQHCVATSSSLAPELRQLEIWLTEGFGP
ncbi:MAG: DUF305 domain-containing protein [Myxococcota bacterium]